MVQRFADLLGVSTAVALAVMVLLAIQLALQIFGLLDLARRPRVLGGRKWVWVLVVIFGNLLGVVIYLAVGRRAPAPATDPERAGGQAARDRAIDRLYGDRERR